MLLINAYHHTLLKYCFAMHCICITFCASLNFFLNVSDAGHTPPVACVNTFFFAIFLAIVRNTFPSMQNVGYHDINLTSKHNLRFMHLLK